jgi:O-antigen/teichoic acid export membrane protein
MKRISEFISTIKAHQGKKALGKALSVSVLNQMVSSGTNFALGIYLVQMLPPEEFGLYGIGFAVIVFFVGIGNALFLTQMLIHTPDKTPEDREPYAARILIALAIFCAILFLLTALVLFLGNLGSDFLAANVHYGIAVAVACMAHIFKEFFVRHAYNHRKEGWALSVNITLAASMICLLAVLHLAEVGISVQKALWIYAIAHLVAALFGHSLIRLPLSKIHFHLICMDMREAWLEGKWALVSHFIYYLRVRSTTIIAAILLGPTGVATLSAAQLFIAPVVMLIPALSQVFLPRAIQAKVRGQRDLQNTGLLFTALLLAVALLYSVAILISFEYIDHLIIGDQYGSLYLMVAVLCLNACILAIKNGIEIIVQSKNEFSRLLLINTLSAPITLLVVGYLTFTNGILGCIVGAAFGELVFLTLLAISMKFSINQSRLRK